MFSILFNRQNERCQEIVISVHQNAENEHNETLNKKDRSVDSFKICFANVVTIARLFESPFENNAFHKSYHANKLPNKETFFYIVWLGKINDVQKSRFQFTKILKINIIKRSILKDRTVDSCKIWSRHVCMNARLF